MKKVVKDYIRSLRSYAKALLELADATEKYEKLLAYEMPFKLKRSKK